MRVDSNNQFPKARHEKLIVKELPDETLVYDLVNDKAHCLNDTAGKVWKNCDGLNSVAEIRAILAEDAGAPVDERVVWLALDQLEKFKLLDRVPTAPPIFSGMSRRSLMRTLGVAAIALPAVMSIVAPTTAEAASKLPPGSCCSANGDCNSVNCAPCGTPCPSCPAGKRCA
jgi:hypothetical protein